MRLGLVREILLAEDKLLEYLLREVLCSCWLSKSCCWRETLVRVICEKKRIDPRRVEINDCGVYQRILESMDGTRI